MGKKISKKLAAGTALGAAVLAPIGVGLNANAYETARGEYPEEGKTDENGRLYGYYDDDGKWQGNYIDIRIRTGDEHVLKVYRVSEDVDLSQRESYIVNANTIASKWCIKDATTRRVLSGVVVNAKNADGKVVGTYTTDKDGFIYYEDLPVGNYTLEAVSVPSGFSYEPEKITRCDYVEDIVMDADNKVMNYFQYFLSLPTSTYVLYLVKDYETYKGFTTASHDQYYNIGPQQLVLKMKGGIPLQWITLGNMDTTVPMGYYIYEVDKDGNNLGSVSGVKAHVQAVNILTGQTVYDETIGSGSDGMAMTKYDGKEPENFEYVFSLGDPPDGLAYYYPSDKNFAFSPIDGANGDELIKYIPVVATSSINVKVYDQKTGAAISGATVQLLDENGKVFTNTDGLSEFKTGTPDANGYNCVIDGLITGQYKIKVIDVPDDGTEEGYAIPDLVVNVTSEKGKIHSYEIPVAHYGHVKVDVLDADSGGIISDKNISVNLYRGVETTPFANLTIDEFATYYRKGKILEDSNITVELVFPTGTYSIDKLLHNVGGTSSEVEIEKTGTYHSQYSKTLSRDGLDLTYVLSVRTGSLTVTVQDKTTKDPIANAEVEVYDKDGKVVGKAKTDANGEIKLEKLLPGDYTAKVVDPTDKYLPNDDAIPLTVVVDTNTKGVIELTRSEGYVQVSVVEKLLDGSIVPFEHKLPLKIFNAADALLHSYQTNANGVADTKLLDAGNYKVELSSLPEGYSLISNKQQVFDVTHGNTTNIIFTIERDRNDLSVLVVDDETDKPLAGSEVTIYNSDGSVCGVATTDANGNISIANVPTGTYTALVTNPTKGYNAPTKKQTITVTKTEDGSTTIRLTREKADVTIKVEELMTGAIVPGAVVEFGYYDNDGTWVVLTGNDGTGDKTEFNLGNVGHVTLKNVPTDTYIARIKTPYPAHYLATNEIEKQFEVVENANNIVVLKLELKMVLLSFDVVDKETREPLANTTITITSADGNVLTGTTDANGFVSFGKVPANTYEYYASKTPTGYTAPAKESVNLDEANGDVHRTIELTRDKGSLVITSYVGNTNTILPGATVEVRDENGNVFATVTTDENGKAIINDVPTGDYDIIITDAPDGYTPSANDEVTVEKGEQADARVEATRDLGQLVVTAYNDYTGGILAGVEITVTNGEHTAKAITDNLGQATFILPTGDYEVKLTSLPERYHVTKEDAVSITKDGEHTAEVRADRDMGKIQVIVKDGKGTPDTGDDIMLSNVDVKITDIETGESYEAKTDENGQLVTPSLPTGNYKVEVTGGLSYIYTIPSAKNAEIFPDDTTVVIFNLSEDKNGLNVLVVEEGTTHPLPNVKVTISHEGMEDIVMTTDAYGYVRIPEILVGAYIAAVRDADAPAEYKTIAASTSTVFVTKDADGNAILELARRKGDLNVLIQDKDTKEPIPGAKVEIYDEDGKKVGEGVTDENGNLIVENLPTGDYTIKVTEVPDGYNKPDDKTATIEDEKTTDVVIEIEKKKGNLDIIVQDKDTKEPIPGAKVEIYDEDGNKVGEGVTDENGNLIVEDLPIGDYTIKVTEVPDGYNKPDDKVATVEDEKTTEVVIEAEKKKGDLDIIVLDKDTQDPIPNAKVEVYDKDGNKVGEGVTDENGNLIVENLPIGDYTIKVTEVPDGYNKPDDKTASVEDEKVTKVIVEVEKKKGDLDITVLDKDTQEPIPNAKVEIYDEDGNKVGEGVTDENGNLIVEDLPIGDYTIKVTEVPDGYNKPDDKNTTVEEDKTTEVVIEVEKEKGGLNIIVRDKDTDELIPGAKVEVYDEAGNKVGEGITDENGNLIVEDLPIGDYTIKVTEVPDGYNKPDDKTASVEEEKLTDVIIEVEKKKGDLDILVKDKDTEEPIPGAEVVIKDKDGNIVAEGITDENGNLIVEDLPIGDYTVEVKDVPDGYNKPDDKDVTVKEDETTEVIIVVEKQKGDLEILIQDKDTKEPIPGAKVEIYDEDGNKVGEGTTDENGNLIVEDLPIGDYTIKVTEVPDGYNKPDDKVATVEDEKVTEVIIEVEKKKGDLDILVQDKDTKEPIPGAKIEIYDENGNKVGEGTTDENGKLIVEDLPIGDYTIKVTEVPDGYNKPDDKTATVEDEKVTEVVVEVEKKKGDLEVLIQDKDTKEPIPGAKVEIYDEDGNKVGEGTTDENGNLIVEDLPIGDYTIKVTEVPDGYNKPADKTAVVEDENTTKVVIEIGKQKGDLKVTVIDKETKEPLKNALVAITDKDGNILHTLKTDSDGNIFVEDMLAGEYTIAVIEAPDGYSAPDAITAVVKNEETTEVIIELTRDKGNLSITVEDKETKELLPNIQVVVKDEDGNIVGEYTTNENGQVLVQDLPTGKYTVETKDLPDIYRTPEIKSAEVEKGETADVLISLEKATGSLTMVAKEKDTSNYLKGVEFQVYDENGNLIGTYTSDENGSSLAEKLVVGRYTIKVTKVPDGFKLPANAKEAVIVVDMNTTVLFELERVQENVQTGDNSNIGLHALMAGLSGVGIIATRRKKNKNSN